MKTSLIAFGGLFLAVGLSGPAFSQEAPKPAVEAPAKAEEEMIQLNFPENFEVRLLIDFVTKRLGMNILYEPSIGSQKVTISAPTKIPASSLLGLLESVLKMAGLTMVDAEQPGWKKVVQAKDFLDVSRGFEGDPLKAAGTPGAVIITQIFQIEHAPVADVEKVIKPFLSKPGGNTFIIPNTNLLLVTDYAFTLKRAAALIQMVDVAGTKVSMRFITAEHLDATELAKSVNALMVSRDQVAGVDKSRDRKISLTADTRSNRLVLVSVESAEQEVLDLIKEMDVPSDAQTRSYRFKYVAAQRFDKIARELAGSDVVGGRYKSILDAESGLLIVTASPKVHAQIEALRADLDVAGVSAEDNQMCFYKLMNTTASEVLATISQLTSGQKGALPVISTEKTGTPAEKPPNFSGPNSPPTGPGQDLPTPPSYTPNPSGTGTPSESPVKSAPTASSMTARAKDAVITADPNTNTIIVIATPAVQKVYEDLIAVLDKRRPQVMIEVTLVTVDTSNNLSLGVELAQQIDLGDDNQALVFSSFGLSKIDPKTGIPTPTAGAGFNGVLISPDTVNVVLRALATSGRATVLSAPKVLVNDNATATLASVAEAPFTSVNASQTVSTTTFAGYASAGTTITVTPHISEGDHLQLEYSVALNSFTGEGSSGVPPPRQTNTLNSRVTVPDGQVIVVGGLTRKDASDTVSKIPLLGDIPIVGLAFSSRTLNNSQSTLFAFIRPVVLRDDHFEDLRHLSDKDMKRANMPPEPSCPGSKPIVMQ